MPLRGLLSLSFSLCLPRVPHAPLCAPLLAAPGAQHVHFLPGQFTRTAWEVHPLRQALRKSQQPPPIAEAGLHGIHLRGSRAEERT